MKRSILLGVLLLVSGGIILALELVGRLNQTAQEPPSFETQIQSIRIGMSKAQVENVLGRPDDVQTPEDHGGTWLHGISEVWSYGAKGHRAPARRGSLYFDEAGRVQSVYGQNQKLQPPE